jgi:hypothetical protein
MATTSNIGKGLGMAQSTCFLAAPRLATSASYRSMPAGWLALGCLCAAAVQGAILDFDGLNDLDPVGSSYAAQGVTFNNAVVLKAGMSLNDFEFPPRSGLNVASDDGGPISGAFSTPVSSLWGYFTYSVQITWHGFDASNTEVVSTSSLFLENFVGSGDPPNELLGLSFPGGIYSFRIDGDPQGGSFVMDDFGFTPIPEASSTAVVVAALGAFALFRRGRFGSRKDA